MSVASGRSPRDTRRILEALPDWFGDPVAIDNDVFATEDAAYGNVLAVGSTGVVGTYPRLMTLRGFLDFIGITRPKGERNWLRRILDRHRAR